MPSGVYIRTEETRKKLSDSHKGLTGRFHSEDTKKKISLSKKGKRNFKLLGRHMSEETRKKLSDANTGKKRVVSIETRKRLSEALLSYYANGGVVRNGRLGKKASKETPQKLSDSHRGKKVPSRQKENCHFWKGGITEINRKIRASLDYRVWRTYVFKRDNFVCILCECPNEENLEAHHINNFGDYPELRFIVDNGVTLCKNCHKLFHNKFGKKNNTKEQLNEFIKKEMMSLDGANYQRC